MRMSMVVRLSTTALASVALAGLVSAQVPTRTSEPRLAVPRSDLPVAQTQPPGQPTTAPATTAASTDTTPTAAPVTQVTGGASGVTQLGGGAGTQPTSSSSYAATAGQRTYTSGSFALTLAGLDAGFPSSVEGGGPASDVVVEKLGPDNISHKHLAGVKYDDISLSTTLNSKPLMDWIAESWDGKNSRKDGSLIAVNFDRKAMSELQFFHALISETTFPKLDAAGKDAARITVKLSPEYTRFMGGSGRDVTGGTKQSLQKKWLPSDFHFQMTGLDGSRVNSIESFTVSQKVVDNAVGEQRDYERQPPQIEFPNLKITLSEAYAQTWYDWLNDFVVQGHNTQDKERDGAIIYLSHDLKPTELGRINLFGCGIFGLNPDKADARSENIRRVTADLYCERMQLVVPKATN